MPEYIASSSQALRSSRNSRYHLSISVKRINREFEEERSLAYEIFLRHHVRRNFWEGQLTSRAEFVVRREDSAVWGSKTLGLLIIFATRAHTLDETRKYVAVSLCQWHNRLSSLFSLILRTFIVRFGRSGVRKFYQNRSLSVQPIQNQNVCWQKSQVREFAFRVHFAFGLESVLSSAKIAGSFVSDFIEKNRARGFFEWLTRLWWLKMLV